MARSGDWITPHLWGHPWFEKSPLLYWMTGLAALLGLGPELAPRLPVALTAFGLIVFLYLFLKPRLGSGIATHSAILLAGSAGWLAFGGVGVTDVLLTANLTVSILLVLFGGPAWLAGVFLGLAALAKGLVPIALFLPLIWWLYRNKRLSDLLWIAAAGLIVAGPWYAAITWRHGRAFFDEFILKQHLGRFADASLQHGRPFWFYVPVLALILLPWSALLPFAFWRRAAFTNGFLKDARLRFLAAWALFVLIFFSAFMNKLPGYILPLLPVTCILIAAALEDMRGAGSILDFTAVVLVAVGPPILQALPRLLNDGWKKTTFSSGEAWFLLPGLLIGFLFYWLDHSRRRTLALCGMSCLMMSALLWAKWGPIASEVDRLASARSLSKTASKDGCVHPGDRDLRYGLSYYWNFEVPVCNDATLYKRIVRKP